MSFNLQSAICGLQSAVCGLQSAVCKCHTPILVLVIGSRLSLEDFARVLKIKDTAESFILLFSPER